MSHPDRKHRGLTPDIKKRLGKTIAIVGCLATGIRILTGCGGSTGYPTVAPGASVSEREAVSALVDRHIGYYSPFQGNPCTTDSPPDVDYLEIYRQQGQSGEEEVLKYGECEGEPTFVVRTPGEGAGERIIDAEHRIPVLVNTQGRVTCDADDAGKEVIEVFSNPDEIHREVNISACPSDSNSGLAPLGNNFVVLNASEQAFFEQDYQAKTRAQTLIGTTYQTNNQEGGTIDFSPKFLTAIGAVGIAAAPTMNFAPTTAGSGELLLTASGTATRLGLAGLVIYAGIESSLSGRVQNLSEGNRGPFYALDLQGRVLYQFYVDQTGYAWKNIITAVDEHTRVFIDATGNINIVSVDALGEAISPNPGGNPSNPEIQPTPNIQNQQSSDNQQENKKNIPQPHLSEKQQQHDSVINGNRLMKDEFIEAYWLVRTTRSETNAEIIKQATPLRGLSDIEVTKAIFDTETNRLLVGSWNASHEQIVAAYEGPGGIQNYNLGYSSRYFSGILYTVGKQQRPVFILDNDTGLDFNRIYALQQKEFDLMSPRGEWFVLRFDPLGYVRIPSALYGSLR